MTDGREGRIENALLAGCSKKLRYKTAISVTSDE
jgi:hypothetical protein